MSTTNDSGFEGPVPSSIKPTGFPCYRRDGCDREALCEAEAECLGGEPPLVHALNRSRLDETAEIERPGVGPPPANASERNRFDEIAEMIRSLTYAEMIEFAGGLYRWRGGGKVNRETLPKILHAWATETKLNSGGAVRNEPVSPAGERDCAPDIQPIDVAPKDRPILAFMLGRWRIARWRPNHSHKRPMPFWSADDLRVTVSRAHQPKWWTELPPAPPEDEV